MLQLLTEGKDGHTLSLLAVNRVLTPWTRNSMDRNSEKTDSGKKYREVQETEGEKEEAEEQRNKGNKKKMIKTGTKI